MNAIQHQTLVEPTPTLLRALLDGPGVVLLAERDRPVGYAMALLADDVAYVPELAVEPDSQRDGVGSQLLGAVGERARQGGCDELRLTVRADDEDARAFYRNQGFDVVERLPEHYETGSGVGLLLAKRL